MTLETPLQAAAPVASMLLSLIATRWLVSRGPARGPVDYPNERSLHSAPVPRSGGLAVLLGLAAPLVLVAAHGGAAEGLRWMGLALLPVASVAYLDDLGEVPRWVRLIAQGAAALVLMAGGLTWSVLELPGWAQSVPFPVALLMSLIYVVWLINLYNFMDGMDGFAGGMALFGFSALAILGWIADDPLFTLTAACVAMAAAGFLAFNFPPARIFLGDSGSSSLGLLVAGLSLWGAARGVFPLWVAWLAFSPFIVDATWTLLARAARREAVWEPHRSHHYQRLVLAGWSHRKTVLHSYLLMGAAAACAVAAPGLPPHDQWLLLGAWAVIYGLVHLKVLLVERGAAGPR